MPFPGRKKSLAVGQTGLWTVMQRTEPVIMAWDDRPRLVTRNMPVGLMVSK